MFRRNTVFIVGAGASKELGLPVGSELAELISAMCNFRTDAWGAPESAETRQILFALNQQAQGDSAKVADWRFAMEEIRSALPFKDSIDSVIDQHYDRPEVAEIGKYMIAKLILAAEAKSALKGEHDGRSEPDLRRAKDSWLHAFARMLFEGLRKDRLQDIGDNVSVICFNYDRCIERYLAQAISETYGLSHFEAIEVAARVPILHAYGSLGALPDWPGIGATSSRVPFGDTGQSPWKVSANIQTFSESVDGTTDDAIKALVANAEQYVYLGFSFGRQNMELLGANSRTGQVRERYAFASGLGQYEQGRDAICRLIQRTYCADKPITTPGTGPYPKTKLELNTTAKVLLDLHWHNILG